jgi:outer membrane protein TolC
VTSTTKFRAQNIGLQLLPILALALGGCVATAQVNPTSATNPYNGSVTNIKASADPMPLSLDDAIRRGLEFNLALINAQQNLRSVQGEQLQSLQGVLPTVTGEGETGFRQISLVALGFNPSIAAALLPPGVTISPIQEVAFTDAQANLRWRIFDLSAIQTYRAAKEQTISAEYHVSSVRGLVVLSVGTAYLQVLAQAATLDNAVGLLATDRELLRRAHEEHLAGTAANLDELRARVAYQQQEQTVVAAGNALEKAKIALARQIGIPPEQKLQLTDPVPYAELTLLSLDEARQRAYRDRQDYQTLQHATRAAVLQRSAAKAERLPTLNGGGNYGVTGVTTGLYHGTFIALASIDFPIFREARLRGDVDVADAQVKNQEAQLADLRSKIDAQLRDSFLDIRAADQLVAVSRSNVGLATETLDDATMRFKAGVDDTLPVVQAEAQLVDAQARLVQSLFQLNTAKLGLARNLGILEYEYSAYLNGPGTNAPAKVPPPPVH